MLVMAIVAVMAFGLYGPYWRVAPGVTPTAIRAVRVGMTHDEVARILGQPLQSRTWGLGGTVLDYARPHPLAPWSSRLWVYLRNGRVDTVQGERVPLIANKRGVYLLRTDRAEWASTEFEATFQPWWMWAKSSAVRW